MTASAIVTPLTPTAAGHKTAMPVTQAESEVHRLTTAMARGDENAFREFHAAYFHRLLRYLFVVTHGDEEAARDALQETFTRVARHARPFDSEEVFWSWLTLLARSAATDGLRKRRRYGLLLSRFAFFWKTEQPIVQQGEDVRLDRFLAEAVAVLEPIDRALIEQKYFADASVREIATSFGLTEKAVESRLARARRALRAELVKRINHETRD